MDDQDDSTDQLASYKAKCAMYESWLRAIDKYANYDVWFKDLDGRYRFVNANFEKSVGRTRDELLGRSPQEIFSGEGARRAIAMDQKVIEEGYLARLVPCDEGGTVEMHKEQRFAVLGEDDQPAGIGCFAHEPPVKSISEYALARAQQMASLGSWRWSICDLCLISCSDQFAKIFEISVTKALSMTHSDFEQKIHPSDLERVRDAHRRRADPEFGCYEIEYRIILKDGSVRYVREIAEPLVGNNGVPVEYAGALQDITRQKEAEAALLETKLGLERKVEQRTGELKLLATHDHLTGLLNRTGFYEEVSCLDFYGEGISIPIIVLDLNGFKRINDSFGHSTGDFVLREIALRLKNLVSDDAIIARLGGDEFGIALPATAHPMQIARGICQNIETAIRAKITHRSLELFVGASFGVSLLGEDCIHLEEGLQYADIALYQAKDSPQSIIAFEKSMASEIAMKQQLEHDLRNALRDKAIFVEYQPQVLLQNGAITGVEALARWYHPRYGMISPDVFIGIAENCGLIDELGEHILRTSCQQIGKLMREAGTEIRLSVNLSAVQFYKKDLCEKLLEIVAECLFDPKQLELEITESVFIQNIEHTRRALDSMRELGVRIALDDFGIGYSSLSYLHQFSVDRIKLDRSFIQTLDLTDRDRRMVKGIVALAKSLDIELIAEGVENARQCAALDECGCGEVQGYYYSKPVSITELTDLLSAPKLKAIA